MVCQCIETGTDSTDVVGSGCLEIVGGVTVSRNFLAALSITRQTIASIGVRPTSVIRCCTLVVGVEWASCLTLVMALGGLVKQAGIDTRQLGDEGERRNDGRRHC